MKHYSRIKSFVLRQGRFSSRQKAALDSESEHYLLDCKQSNYDWSGIFANPSRIVLEIGFGMGQSLLAMAKAHPETCFIGIEVHKPGVGALIADLKEQEINNVRIFCADAMQVVSHCLQDNSLDAIHIFFPDPWPKRRHHKRRLIQPEFVELLCRKLKIGSYLHLATDWQDYADYMLKVLSAQSNLSNTKETDYPSHRRIERPLTKYEARGQRLGHEVWDLVFYKNLRGVKS